jgi:D-alanyl-D-alanine carboxypeptidase
VSDTLQVAPLQVLPDPRVGNVHTGGMPTGTAPAEALVAAELGSLMARLARRRGVRHVTLGAMPTDGSWTWSDAIGTADVHGTSMRPDTPWMIASITKLFIAAVILKLHEQGRLELRAPVTKHLPDEFHRGLHVHRDVDHTGTLTAVHLLGHLSGLPDYLDERPADGPSLMEQILAGPDRRWTPEDAVRHARDRLRTHFPPSDPQGPRPRIRYSDTNFQLLVVVAQHVTATPIDELYRELLFEPLGLGQTWLPGRCPTEPNAGHTAEPAGPAGPTGSAGPAAVWLGDRPFDDRPGAMSSFGDLYSTTGDLLRFGSALVSGSLFGDPTTGHLMRARFRRFGLPRSVATLRAPSWPIEYGLGTMRFEVGRALALGRRIPTLIGHTGSTGSWLWHVPTLDLVVTGTVDQVTAAAVPFQAVPRALATIDRARR